MRRVQRRVKLFGYPPSQGWSQDKQDIVRVMTALDNMTSIETSYNF